MSIFPVQPPEPDPLDGGPGPSPDLEPLLEAWSEALRADLRASELKGLVDTLRERLDQRTAQMTLVGQVARLLSTALRIDQLAPLLLETLQTALGARVGIVWTLGQQGFAARAGLGLHRRQLEALRLSAPQPFPGYPLLLYQAQWVDPKVLPPAARGLLELNLRPGEGCYFFPFEQQMLLVGFALLALPEGQEARVSDPETLETIQRLFAVTIQNLWLVQDLEFQREVLRRQAADLEQQSRALAQQNTALREGETIRTEFLAFAAHELRHQLAGVLAPLSRLREVARSREDAADVLEGLLAGKHMAELLTDLLELARPGPAGVGSGAAPVEPGPLLEEVRTLLDSYPRRGSGPIDWPAGEELPAVMADRERFKQILLSLCAASLRHSLDGSLGLWVEREPLSLVFCLRIPSLDLRPVAALLAGKGFGTSYVQGQGAAGLGLLISRQLVAGMGGRLRLDADYEGRGGLVRVELGLA